MLDFDCWLILRIAEWINDIRFDTRLKRIVWLQEDLYKGHDLCPLYKSSCNHTISVVSLKYYFIAL